MKTWNIAQVSVVSQVNMYIYIYVHVHVAPSLGTELCLWKAAIQMYLVLLVVTQRSWCSTMSALVQTQRRCNTHGLKHELREALCTA